MQHLTWLNPCFSFIFLVQETPELGTYAQMLKRDPMKDKSATVFVCACVCTIALAATCDMLLPQQDVSHDQRGSASQDAAEAGVFPSFIFVHLTNFYLEKPMCFFLQFVVEMCVFPFAMAAHKWLQPMRESRAINGRQRSRCQCPPPPTRPCCMSGFNSCTGRG